MNKGSERKQLILRNEWFDNEDGCIIQSMNFLNNKSQWTQKEIQRILEEQRLRPAKGLNLCCFKPKCFNCQIATNCKICIKGYKCDTYKIPQKYSLTSCSKNWNCNAYIHSQKLC